MKFMGIAMHVLANGPRISRKTGIALLASVGVITWVGAVGTTVEAAESTTPTRSVAQSDELESLKAQAEQLRQQNQMLVRRVDQLEQRQQNTPPVAQPTVAASRATALPTADGSLTWKGITLYGAVDIGLAYSSHSGALNDTFAPGYNDLIIGAKNAKKSFFGFAPNSMTTSKVGLKGIEPLLNGWSAIFKIETGFNPLSGRLIDGLHSLTDQNGVPLAQQNKAWGDATRAGQPFQGGAFIGVSHAKYGTLTVGRQNSVLWDNVIRYDPAYASNLSFLGFAGTAGGGGDTEDRLLDNTLKYTNAVGPIRGAILYASKDNGYGEGWQAGLGATYRHVSVDVAYSFISDAIAASPLTTNASGALSTAQVAALSLGGFTLNNTVAATVSDNTSWQVAGMYDMGKTKIYAGYERIEFANPHNPLSDKGFVDGLGVDTTIGGYDILTNSAAYSHHKILDIYWAGARYKFSPRLEAALGYYLQDQNNFSISPALAGCKSRHLSGQCSGSFDGINLTGDYKVIDRFDVYAAAVWSEVVGGVANGYLKTNSWGPTIGGRFSF